MTGGSRSHDRRDLFGTPLSSSGTGPGKLDNPKNRTRLETQVHLFKTPTSNLGSNGGAQPPSKRKAGGHGPTLDDEVSFMSGQWLSEDGKDYGPAVARWERVTSTQAPSPTEPGDKVARRLSARFSEWMMGHVPGWITDTPGLTRTEQHTVIGGGVVQRQAEDAFLFILTNWPDIPEQDSTGGADHG